jgi:hypothetical protein
MFIERLNKKEFYIRKNVQENVTGSLIGFVNITIYRRPNHLHEKERFPLSFSKKSIIILSSIKISNLLSLSLVLGICTP